MIEISQLSFRYREGADPILKGIDLSIPDGAFVGVTGAAGSGKSTLTYAINGIIPHCYPGDFYGSVRVDGVDTCEVSLTDISRLVGSVCQDIDSQMVSSVVEDEVLYGLENFGVPKTEIPARVDEALAAMGIADLRDRSIAELSGGQKQRSSIARALLKNAPVLIMDDSLSAVDTDTEEQILENLIRLRKGKTTIIIAHRVSTLQKADHIAVLTEGELTEYGTHDELIREGGFYAKIYEKQQLEQELNEM